MIVKNEEKTLGRCLDTIKDIVDEIVIVDTGSTDRTKEVARRYTKAIFDFEWVYDFSVARNYSFSKATKEYILWLDADDVLFPKEAEKLKSLKETLDTSIDVVYMPYHLLAEKKGDMPYIFWRERLVRRDRNYKWQEPVHECLYCPGKAMKVEIVVTHQKQGLPTRRNLEIFERYIASGHTLSNRNLFYYGRELFHQGEIEKGAAYYEAYLETRDGLMVTYLNACLELAKYYERKGNDKKCLQMLLKYFEIDKPRAEICCEIGYFYKKRKDYDKAITWFYLAPYTPRPLDSIGGIKLSCWDYVPYMELSACCFRKGEIERAIYFNEKAASIHPQDEKVLHNRAFLEQQRKRREK